MKPTINHRFAKKNRVLLNKAVRESHSVVVVNNIRANMLNLIELEEMSEDFIIDRSDLILSVFGSNKNSRDESRHIKLNEIEKDVIFLNYAT